MSYIELLNRFDLLDSEQAFSASATRLYVKILAECNRGRWQNPFTLTDRKLNALMGGSVNTMKKARTELEERGLLSYQTGGNGAGDGCVYALQNGSVVAPLKVSKSDTLPENKVSGMVSEIDTLNVNKVSEKVSISDTIIYKEEDKTSSVVREEEEEPAPSPAPVEKKYTSQPESKKAEPKTEGGRAPSVHADDAQLTTADACPLLANPHIFKAACLDINRDYTGIDFEHYRQEMLFDSREKKLELMPYEWRKRLRNWLTNAKGSRNGLIMAAIPGQTKGDPRAVKPLAATSSASPTKKKSWS